MPDPKDDKPDAAKPPIAKPAERAENEAKADKAAREDLLEQLADLEAAAAKQGSSLAEIIAHAGKSLLGLDL